MRGIGPMGTLRTVGARFNFRTRPADGNTGTSGPERRAGSLHPCPAAGIAVHRRMTEHKKRLKKSALACNWVEEEGFMVIPKGSNGPRKPNAGSQTAFTHKPKGHPHPLRPPTS